MKIMSVFKKVFVCLLILYTAAILTGCISMTTTANGRPNADLDIWAISRSDVYHITSNGVKNMGIFKPWYKLSRFAAEGKFSWELDDFYYDYKYNRIFFIAGNDYLAGCGLFVWDLNDELNRPKLLSDGTNQIIPLQANNKLYVFTGSLQHKKICTIDLHNKNPSVKCLYDHRERMMHMALSPNGKMLAFSSNNSLWILDLQTNNKRLVHKGLDDSLMWVSDHELFYVPNGWKNSFTIIDTNTFKISTYSIPKSTFDYFHYASGYIYLEGLSPNGKVFLIRKNNVSNNLLWLFDVEKKTMSSLKSTDSNQTFRWLQDNKGFFIVDPTYRDFSSAPQGIFYYSIIDNEISQLGTLVPKAFFKQTQTISKIDQDLILDQSSSRNYKDALFEKWEGIRIGG